MTAMPNPYSLMKVISLQARFVAIRNDKLQVKNPHKIQNSSNKFFRTYALINICLQYVRSAFFLCTDIYSIHSKLDQLSSSVLLFIVFTVCLLYSSVLFLWPTCAILWCWMSITRDMAIWTLPNTATTSRILSSKLGAWNVCGKNSKIIHTEALFRAP